MKNSIATRLLIALLCMVFIPLSIHAQWQSDDTYGFKIKIPSDWSKNSSMDGTDQIYDYYSPDENLAIQIRAFKSSPELTVAFLAEVYENNYLAPGTNKTSLKEHTSRNGIPGLQGVYTMDYNGLEVALMIFYAIQNDNGYVLSAYLPSKLVEERGGELKQTLQTFMLEGFQAEAPKPVESAISIDPFGNMASATTTSQAGYNTLVVDDAGIEFSMPADFQLSDKQPGQSIYTDGKIKMIIQTVHRDGNNMEDVAKIAAQQIFDHPNAEMIDVMNTNIGNLRVKKYTYSLKQGSTSTYFNYVYMDSPGNIMALGFVSPGSMSEQNDKHYDIAVESLRKVEVKTDPTNTNTTQTTSGNNAGVVGKYNFVSRSDGKNLLNYHFIDVKSDGTYKEEYQLKSTGNYIGGNNGTWQLNGDLLTLTMEGGISDDYKVNGSQLIRTSGGGIVFTFQK